MEYVNTSEGSVSWQDEAAGRQEHSLPNCSRPTIRGEEPHPARVPLLPTKYGGSREDNSNKTRNLRCYSNRAYGMNGTTLTLSTTVEPDEMTGWISIHSPVGSTNTEEMEELLNSLPKAEPTHRKVLKALETA
ncbi:hypothetical protein ACLKA7_000064 [Drosophila subpalustris]